MSSFPLEEGYKAAKDRRERGIREAFHSELKAFVLQNLILPPDDGLGMAIDAAFQVNRKDLVVRSLRELADELERKR